MRTEYIVGIGEILWDMLPEGRRLGGAPANFAYHASQFGMKSMIVSAVGKDEAGDAALMELNASGKNTGGFGTMISRVDFPTGTVSINLDSAGVPQYDIHMPAAWDNIPFTPELKELASKTRAVCFGTLARRSPVSHRTISDFVEAVPRGEGQWRILDINLRQHFYTRDIILHALGQCNILKINDEELAIISEMLPVPGTDMWEQCRQLLRQFDLKFLILTCGTHGSYIFYSDSENPSFIETPHVTVADTVGAGDSFTAAFIAALIKGHTPLEAHRLAVDVSAFVCTCNGAMPVLPDTLRRL
ncbi:MAG TPA: carbohydrate kinase [Candidatus Coprenecus pullistercoris]|nr:carbohydrate kinase [Candidatus Coprenecus pullistercoris]